MTVLHMQPLWALEAAIEWMGGIPWHPSDAAVHGHCCCIVDQLPAEVLTLPNSIPTLVARSRGVGGPVQLQMMASDGLFRSVGTSVIAPARISRADLDSASSRGCLWLVSMTTLGLQCRFFFARRVP